ncbi:MAG: ABC transporter substrate-binding protein [Candidatus Pacebacteria bacterium]|nr:ABC transporter substrate-binding protein [Candidatus Paceibacterota bacterium]
MKKSILLLIAFVVIVAVAVVFLAGFSGKKDLTTKPGIIPASENIIFKKVSSEDAVKQLINHDIDVYLGTLSPDDAVLLKNSNINIYTAPSQFFGLDFNPAPSTKDIINPFSVKEFRFSINNLINKQEIVDTILKGYGAPKKISIFDSSPDYNLVRDIVDSYNLSYNQTVAVEKIDTVMLGLGAVKNNGKWYFKNKPVVLKIAIYEGTAYGEVKEIGEYVAAQFEKIGFDVEKIYYDGSKETVLNQDPKDLAWNIRINTAIYYSASKYDDYDIISQSPFMKSLSGSSKEGSWNYENEKLDSIGKKLFNGDYADENEWVSLLRDGTKEIIDNAYSIQLVTKNQIFAADKDVKGINPSNYVGIRELQNFKSMYITGKNKVVIGTKETYKKDDPFNYYWFATNIYRMDIKQCLRDFPGWNNQNTLEYEDNRWGSEVTTAGPKGKLDIPSDAFMWNSAQHKWVNLESGLSATTKITFDLSKYIGTKWHDGSIISWADILYALYVEQESIHNEKWIPIADMDAENVNKIKAFRIVDDKHLEVYIDAWHFNKGMIVSQASFIPNNWLLYAGTNKIIYEDNSMMNSIANGNKYGVPAMNLLNKEHVSKVLEEINKLKADEFSSIFTIGDKNYLTSSEVDDKRNNIGVWASMHNNLIITDGPFYLDSYDNESETVYLKANRNSGYSFSK